MALNRGQRGALNVSCGIAFRAILQLAAVLEIYGTMDAGRHQHELAILRQELVEYQEHLNALVAAFALEPAVRDIRPTMTELLHRMGDALSLTTVDELSGYGVLDPDGERALRRQVAELAVQTKKMLQLAAALPPVTC